MKLADIESTEIDWFAVGVTIETKDRRLGRQLNTPSKREVIFGLAGKSNDAEVAELIGMTDDAVCQIRRRAKGGK